MLQSITEKAVYSHLQDSYNKTIKTISTLGKRYALIIATLGKNQGQKLSLHH